MALKPHLAEDANLSKLQFPLLTYPKIDGVRGCFLTDRFTGRSLKPFKNSKLTETFSHYLLKGVDGELVYGKPTDPGLCNKTSSQVNSFTKNTNGELPDLYIFDFVYPSTQFTTFVKRQELLKEIFPDMQNALRGKANLHIIQPNSLEPIRTLEELQQVVLVNNLAGYEGTILRKPSATYKQGRTTVAEGSFLRVKPWKYEEAVVLELLEAEANFNLTEINELGLAHRSSHKENKVGKGQVGSMRCRSVETGHEFICSKGSLTQEQAIETFNSPALLLGKTISFKHMNYGAKDTYRFPNFVAIRSEVDL